ILLTARLGTGRLGDAFHAPPWMWLGGGVGVAGVFAVPFAQPRLRAAATTGILIAGALLIGGRLDRFGLFGLGAVHSPCARALRSGLRGAGAALSLVR